ncbi:MAG: M28 family peptidase [Acidobacteria bacterium]|nr:M28 family peptidase [Acidobacteriota bacterium]
MLLSQVLSRARLLGVALLLAGAVWPADFEPRRYLEHVKRLASDEFKGRGTGTPELERAAGYLAGEFRKLRLKPADGKDYLQPFRVTTNARLGKNNRMEAVRNGDRRPLAFQRDFQPFNFSSTDLVSGGVVFAGYGITAREYNYDDYAGVEVKGKFVIVLRHEPQEFDDKSAFAGRALTEHAQFASKASNAKAHGAAGVLLVNDLANHTGEDDAFEKFARTVGPNNAGIPFVQLKAELAASWLAAAGKNLKEISAAIDKYLQPQSFALPESLRVQVQADIQRDLKTVHNVAAFLPGESDEYVVIGAHYDHLGLGEQFSMAPSQAGTPHPGADDNASGTAGVLELARYFSAQPKAKRGILFLCFAGEELGLLGSSFYVGSPQIPIDKAVAMINLDMIGRIRDGKVWAGGVATGSTLKALLEETIPKHALKVDYTDQAGYGSSDHTSFTARQVPVLFFFSGLHADYHKPSDTWDKIDAGQASELLRLVADLSSRLANGAERPRFVRVTPKGPPAGMTGGGSGSGAWFGSVPDFTELPNGFRFSDVREGSPAALAGLKAGDILFEFDGKPIQNLYDFTYALRARKPGEQVTVKVRRGEQVIEAKVLLAKRN